MRTSKLFRPSLAVAVLLLFAGMVSAQVRSNSVNATINISASESITLTATPASVSLPYNLATNTGTASSPITVTATLGLAPGHNGVYLYSWVNGGYVNTEGSGHINVSINGGGAVNCATSLASQTNSPSGFGIDGQFCGTGFLLAGPNPTGGISSSPSTTYLYTVVDGSFLTNFPSGSAAFTANFEAEAF